MITWITLYSGPPQLGPEQVRYKLLASTNPQHAAAPRPAPPGPAPPGPRVETRVTTNTANTAATAAGPPLPRGLAANLTRLAAAGAGHNNNNNNSNSNSSNSSSSSSNSGQQPPAPGQWAPRLEADRAGMASNAEDFTREFMKQLAGGQ